MIKRTLKVLTSARTQSTLTTIALMLLSAGFFLSTNAALEYEQQLETCRAQTAVTRDIAEGALFRERDCMVEHSRALVDLSICQMTELETIMNLADTVEPLP